MKDDTIPDPHHVARLCNPIHIDEGVIQAGAFMLKMGQDNLSVDWLEYLNCSTRGNEITEIRHIYSKKFHRVSTHAQIAVLNVGQMREKVRKESPDRRNLKVLHNPEVNDQAHSGIYDLKQDDELIAELILESVLETHLAHG